MTDIQKPRRVVKDLPLTRLLPNMLTLFSLCSGLTAMRFALQDRWEGALLGIVIAGIFDMLDGRVARMLNIASKFGAELDSLSDAISFGVAPGFVMYLWVMKENPALGWIAVLSYAVCTALRLARFNTMLEDHSVPTWAKSYFTGIPAPGGAGLAILPLAIWLEFGDGDIDGYLVDICR
jgi:CDP-diacylglycerol--serine O-phosphatidyltransferase